MSSENTTTGKVILRQDLGILMFLISVIGGALITALAGRDLLAQNIVLMIGLFLILLLGSLRSNVAATIVTAVLILSFSVYKLYNHFAYSTAIERSAYLWPLLFVSALFGITLFISMFSVVEGVNSLLNRRIDELTVMDPLTGLENRRSMISSLKRYMALSERNDTDMGLMMIRLRYAEEIRKVLTASQFANLRHILAVTVQDVLRIEDMVFSIDDNASLGIIYFSKEAGAPFIKGRILNSIKGKDMLPDLNEQSLSIDLSVVYLHYNKEMGKDALRFISDVEKEFAYEV